MPLSLTVFNNESCNAMVDNSMLLYDFCAKVKCIHYQSIPHIRLPISCQ